MQKKRDSSSTKNSTNIRITQTLFVNDGMFPSFPGKLESFDRKLRK